MDSKLDGNAAGGILDAVFPFEMTTAEGTCVTCGKVSVIGATMAYMHGMGTVLRCPFCDAVLIRVAEVEGHYWLDMRGIRAMKLH